MLNFFQNKNIRNSANFIKRFEFNFLFKSLIVFYQATFSYFLGGNCRYYPSCSHYAHEAFCKHKPGYAIYLVFKRVLSCHPFSKKSFYDPVPLNSIEMSKSI